MMSTYANPLSRQCIKKILDQMENTFYKIKKNDKDFEIGYFCHINYENETIPAFITKSDVIKEKDNKLELTINNKPKIINLEDFRYKNKEHDVEIVVIEKNQKNEINFIEIDDKLYQKDYEMYYFNQSIYIIQCNNKDIFVSYSLINNINKSELIYNCQLNKNSKYSLIFNLSNNKLIGIYINKSKYYNNGLFFKYIIKEYKKI